MVLMLSVAVLVVENLPEVVTPVLAVIAPVPLTVKAPPPAENVVVAVTVLPWRAVLVEMLLAVEMVPKPAPIEPAVKAPTFWMLL